jgi:uncharacterized protein
MMRSVITGATGFVGLRLLTRLAEVTVLSRDAAKASRRLGGDVKVVTWDPMTGPPPAQSITGHDVVFHLAGESVGEGRWTARKKKTIYDSRVIGTKNLVDALIACQDGPKVLVAASAVGFYGDQGDQNLTEQSAKGQGFLADLCQAWEKESMRAAEHGIRVVCLRIGVVLEQGGGALSKMLLPFKMGVGGRLGHGKQWMSWIHLDDLVSMLLHAAQNDALSGSLNGVSPQPLRNIEFTRALAKALHRPALLPAPALGLKLLLGDFAQEALLASQKVLPAKAQDAGFTFKHPTLDAALAHIFTSDCDDC